MYRGWQNLFKIQKLIYERNTHNICIGTINRYRKFIVHAIWCVERKKSI